MHLRRMRRRPKGLTDCNHGGQNDEDHTGGRQDPVGRRPGEWAGVRAVGVSAVSRVVDRVEHDLLVARCGNRTRCGIWLGVFVQLHARLARIIHVARRDGVRLPAGSIDRKVGVIYYAHAMMSVALASYIALLTI